MPKTMWLLSTADDNYARPLAVQMFSALRHLPADQRVIYTVVEDGISAVNQRRINKIALKAHAATELRWVSAETLPLTGLEGYRHISRAAYLRLFLGSFMPGDCDRVLYLDADMLTCADLTPLWHSDLLGHTVDAVRDMIISQLDDPIGGISDWAEHQVPGDAPTFNSGVLLVDLLAWRNERHEAAMITHARAQAGQGFCDQATLNIFYGLKWLFAVERELVIPGVLVTPR